MALFTVTPLLDYHNYWHICREKDATTPIQKKIYLVLNVYLNIVVDALIQSARKRLISFQDDIRNGGKPDTYGYLLRALCAIRPRVDVLMCCFRMEGRLRQKAGYGPNYHSNADAVYLYF